MQSIKPMLATSIALTTALLSMACGGSGHSTRTTTSPGESLSGQSITLYSGQHEQTTSMLVAAFEKKTGVKVHTRSGDEAELANQILQEGSNSPADVFYTENTPSLEHLREQGLLAPIDPSTLASVPARYSSAQGDWVGVSGRVAVLVYNTQQISPSSLPSSILALAEPKWKGKLGIAPSETDFQPLIVSIAKFDGSAAAEKWLEGIRRTARSTPTTRPS